MTSDFIVWFMMLISCKISLPELLHKLVCSDIKKPGLGLVNAQPPGQQSVWRQSESHVTCA